VSDLENVRKSSAAFKIVILTGASLAWNPRAFKEATALANAGFEVVVYGSNWDQSRLETDQALASSHGFLFQPAIPISRIRLVNRMRSIWRRLCGRTGRELFRHLNIENHWQIGPLAADLLRQARAADADYYIVHLEQAAWVGRRLLQEGKRVGIDFEDWYSEDLLPEAARQRPLRLLRKLEQDLLRQGAHATCPSRAMSEALARTYGCTPPAVIYNAFRWSDRGSLDHRSKDRRDCRIPSIHWYSQTIGHGRGLEDLLAALPHLKHEAEIHLRGNPVAGFGDWLSARIPEGWHQRIFVHGLVSNEELLSRIAEHDIGFAGEMKYSKSRDLTITNKILHYLLAGLAVVASDTSGQQEVAEQTKDSVFLYPSGDASALAAQIDSLLESAEGLARAKAAALHAAEQTFCWERQEKILLDSIAHAIGTPAPYAEAQ
jgi:glycosyltransferase involved in cell wall biosynthesis